MINRREELILNYKDKGVYVDDLNTPKISIEGLNLILKYRLKNINVKSYVLLCQSNKHLEVLEYCILRDKRYFPDCKGKYNLLGDMKRYLKQSYSSDKLLEIAKGVKNNLDVAKYHNRNLSLKEMQNIRLKLQSDVMQGAC